MNILITGGGRGLGKLIVENLSKSNHHIFILDRLPNDKVDSDFLKNKSNYYEVDLNDFESVKKILDEIISKYREVDVIINNAAIRNFHSIEQFTEDEIVKNVKVNFETPVLLIGKILPLMIKNNFGRIINISSISGLQAYSKGSLYCSTKSALMVFTESLALDLSLLQKNITANAILPDSFQTREGEKLKDYEYVTNAITKMTNEFINTNVNGKIHVVSPSFKKIKELLKALFAQYNRFY
jgi:NAD(P)-dependent dehydrogenase (short-subunit alcohol dehydrogenase family)